MSQRYYASTKRHGLCKTPESHVWNAMIQRCYDKNHNAYLRYGGRGIVVCERWRRGFMNFLEDMGRRPSSSYTIGRIDNDGSYCKNNCRWETRRQQQNNRSTSILIEKDGQTMPLTHWSEVLGLDQTTIRWRLRHGWDGKRALETPPDRNRQRKIKRSVSAE